jgi:hypothetical protein
MIIPELGPLLGTLIEPANSGSEDAPLDAVRLSMVGALFDRAGTARGLLASGDEAGARMALGPRVWVGIWEDAADRSAAAVTRRIDRQIRQAAAYSRYPRKRLMPQLPSAEDRRVFAARLSAAGIGLESAARVLESAGAEWQEAQRRMAGELEQSWHRLVQTAHEELAIWEGKSHAIRAWRRAWWPLLAGGGAAIAFSTWIGLMLGGYLPVPDPLRPAAEWIWSLPWP